MERTEGHHILHYEKYHLANPDNKKLRETLGMIACMVVVGHKTLHDECPGVPPLDPYTAQRTRKFMIPDANPLIAIDNYCFAIEAALEHKRTMPIERTVANATIQAVRMQMPFIEEYGVIPE